MSVNIYELGPIDDWLGWMTLKEIKSEHAEFLDPGEYDWVGAEFEAMELRARGLFKQAGWEGDGEFLFAPLPNPDQCDNKYMVAVKQSNNGTVYLWTPWSLGYLVGYKVHIEPRKKEVTDA